MTAATEMLTVGHSTHPIAQFVELLESAGVEAVADVRRFPGSRRHPHFGAEPLAGSLAAAGIGFQPLGSELGGRRRPPAGSRAAEPSLPAAADNSAWRNPSFRAYADHMGEPVFGEGLERLEALARERRTAIMCAEAHPSRCHRRLIADVLVARGWRVLHLLADGRIAAHELSEHAVVEGDRVTYPGPPQLDL